MKEQILLSKNKLGMSEEVIAKVFGISIEKVIEVLAESTNVEIATGFLETKEEVFAAMRKLALTADSEKVRIQALTYLHSEYTGRNDLGEKNYKLKENRLKLEAVNVGIKLGEFNGVLKARQRVAEIILPKVAGAREDQLQTETLEEVV